MSRFSCMSRVALAPNLLVSSLGLILFAPSVIAQQPQLVPQPRELQATGQVFELKPDSEIVLSPATAAEDRMAGETLQDELKFATGHEFPIVSAPSSARVPAIRLARFGDAHVNAALQSAGLNTSGIGDQGYVLDVEPASVVVAGKDAAGLFYGVQTLRQLVTGNGDGVHILGAHVRDWPSLTYRGAQVDMSRGPVPKLSYLERIVQSVSEFKMNQLYMYMEDAYRLDGQPLVGLLTDTLSRDDWKELVAYAARYHVDIVPATEACGHLHKILRFEQYGALGERLHGHGLAADDPQGLAFLDTMYQQMVPVFPTPVYNVGCDETFDLGMGRSAQRMQKEGYGQVYVDELIKVADLVHRYNKQVEFWGDIAVEHPEMIPRLPKDLIVASWEYGAHPSYNRWLKPFAGTGMKILVCPWAGNTSVIMADYEESAVNIENFLTDGKQAGALGTDITAWNDDGETLYGVGWWSIVYGAACAWETGKTPTDEFNRKYDWVFYRNTDHRFADEIQALSRVNETLRGNRVGQMYDMEYGGTGDSLFWHDPFTPEGQGEVSKALPLAPQIRTTAEQAYTVFVNGESDARRNADTLANLEFAALKLDALAMRYEWMQEIAQLYADALAHEHDKNQDVTGNELGEIESTNGRLEDLRDYTTRLRELYRQLWLSENLPNWLPNILQLYDRNSLMWQNEIAKFARIEAEHGQGKPLPSADSLGLLTVAIK
jgi:hexosaminidase